MVETKIFAVEVPICQTEPLEHKFVDTCRKCGRKIYQGDTIYHYKGIGLYCPECFFNHIVTDLFIEAEL